jgi:hypothetical protein
MIFFAGKFFLRRKTPFFLNWTAYIQCDWCKKSFSSKVGRLRHSWSCIFDPEKMAKLKERREQRRPKHQEYVDVPIKRKFDLSKFAKATSSIKITQNDDDDFDFFSGGPEPPKCPKVLQSLKNRFPSTWGEQNQSMEENQQSSQNFPDMEQNPENMQKFQENAEEEERIWEIENPSVKVEVVDIADVVDTAESVDIAKSRYWISDKKLGIQANNAKNIPEIELKHGTDFNDGEFQ